MIDGVIGLSFISCVFLYLSHISNNDNILKNVFRLTGFFILFGIVAVSGITDEALLLWIYTILVVLFFIQILLLFKHATLDNVIKTFKPKDANNWGDLDESS